MVLRMLFRYLANNEQLIQRMADSYLMRRAAQMAVALMYRTKSLASEQRFIDMSPEKFKRFMASFRNNIKEEIENVKEDLKRKKT